METNGQRPHLALYLKDVQANIGFSHHAGHQLNADPAGGLPSAESPRPLPAAPLWSLRYPTPEWHWPWLTSEGFWSPAQRNFHVSCSLRGSFFNAKLHGSTTVGKRLWREGSTVGISLYENHIREDDFTAPSTDRLKQQLSCGAVHEESTKPMTGRSDGLSYGDALTKATRKSSEAFHPAFSVYTTSAPERQTTILGTVYGVFKNVIGTIFCIPLPVKPDDCTMS